MKHKVGIISSAYITCGIFTALDHIAEIGFKYVEIAAVDGALEHISQEELTPQYASRIRKELEKRGLAPNAFAAHTQLTEETSVGRMLPRLRFASEIGSCICVGRCGPKDKGDQLKRNLDILVREAEKLCVVLSLETNADYITNGQEGVVFVEQWASPYLGVTFDAGNIFRGTDGKIDTIQDLSKVLKQIKHLHMKDLVMQDGSWRFCLPGTGVIDIAGILKLLNERSEPIGVNLELPYQYRFQSLKSPLEMSTKSPSLKEIDRDALSYLKMVEDVLK
jgi:sugar phosphate isomerase/epimerase